MTFVVNEKKHDESRGRKQATRRFCRYRHCAINRPGHRRSTPAALLFGVALLKGDDAPERAISRLIEHGPFETYSTVSVSGTNGGVSFNELLVEVDDDTWVENNTFTFQEISESDQEVILYDATRETTLFVNLMTNNISVQWAGNELVYDITGVSESLTPVIPDGWLV